MNAAAAMPDPAERARNGACPAAIADYAVIGDCRSAALVSRSGSIEWLCLPLYSSPSLFGAILDAERGGRFRIGPALPSTVTRQYRPGTNVLETTFATTDGTVRIVDAMTIPFGRTLQPMREVLRCIEGIEGSVAVEVEIDVQPDYGRLSPRLEARGSRAWVWTWGNEWLHLLTDAPLIAQGARLVARLVVEAGEKRWMSLAYAQGDTGVVVGLGAHAQSRLDQTTRWWEGWSRHAQYEGPYRDVVIRSALTLKLLTHCTSGAVIAAPTTSLPEAIGGDRNWDYRYCWLRDAALTMRAFTALGYFGEARGFFDWMLHATRLTWPELQVLYDVYGRTHLPEKQLDHWRGFCESRPVRIGNGAYEQTQLDVYGAVCYAGREFVRATGTLASDEARLLRGFGHAVCELWEHPDNGIWEIRGASRHYTFSKVMCWTALDTLIALAEGGHMRVPGHFPAVRAAIGERIETRGYHAELRSYVSVLSGDKVDASLLLMGSLGYRDPRDQRMRDTFSLIEKRLSHRGLLYRYEQGEDHVDSLEGAFGICSLWAIENLARRGDFDEARLRFDGLLGHANDLGLFAEEIDMHGGGLLGNFPQAYTHVGVINAALALQQRV
jgi:GH15 family glucan-1,4-alpha-glucosidase